MNTNYTKLLKSDKNVGTIPNSQFLSATLLNSNILVAHEQKARENAKKFKFTNVSLTLPDSLIDTFGQNEIIRYSTTVQLKLNQLIPPLSLSEVKLRLE